MKYSRPLLAASALVVLGLVLVRTAGPDGEKGDPAPPAKPENRSNAKNGTAPADAKYRRGDRSQEGPDSPDAKTLKLLWARGRGQELLVALDQLSERADDDDWRQVADVLIEQAAGDGRHEIATYLLATGDGAPEKVRLSIYAAAMDNPDEGIRSSARLELLNLTGREFESRQEAEAWIASRPATPEEDPGDGE